LGTSSKESQKPEETVETVKKRDRMSEDTEEQTTEEFRAEQK
jgi:hypothetical protein